MLAATSNGHESEPSSSIQGLQTCRVFEFPEIQVATKNFDESLVIGTGGFGKVYKGNVVNGSTQMVVAIKRLDSLSSQGAAEFWAEVEILSKLRHCNLVSLIGYCNHGKEMLLVYEYMPNGTLEDHLHKRGTTLSWLQRLKICIGAGRGLHYLHTGTGIAVGIIHRDVKSSNILLDETWASKVSDFGLSRIGPTNQPSTYVNTLVKGTFGYLDPDYYATGKLTRKSDVYAFGVVLLEVLCRRRALDRSLNDEQCNLARWAQESIKKGNLKHIIDSDIRDQIYPKCLKEFVRIVEKCLHSLPNKRHTMAEVVVSLESVLNLQVKINNSFQPASRTIFGRMFNRFPFPSNGESIAKGNLSVSSNIKLPTDNRIQTLKEFEFHDLEKATTNFHPEMLLGTGSLGRVFLGWIDPYSFSPTEAGVGVAVAVKKMRLFNFQLWQAEVRFLGRLAHPNIITLLGHCSYEQKRLFVYEYMPNKSFDRFLFTDGPGALKPPLSWEIRLKIMIGIARGLVYLHSLEEQIVYSDVKSSNILLDEDFNAKLGPFEFGKPFCTDDGKTRVVSEYMGTPGYIDPLFFLGGDKLTVKSDIYSFGVVLLETLTGLRVIDSKRGSKQRNLEAWARPYLGRREELKKIMDPRLEPNTPLEGAFKCAALTLKCVEFNPDNRPSSAEVLQTLEQLYATDK